MKTKKSLIILAVCSFITFLSSCSFIGDSYNVVIRDAEHGHFEVEYNGDSLCLIIPYPDEGYMPILETISVFGPDKMDLLVYSGTKVLRIPGKLIAKLQRTTKGARVSTSSSKIDGMNFLAPGITDLVIVTNNGYVNRIPIDILPQSTRGKAGTKVIKLNKGDEVKAILPCREDQALYAYEGGRTNTTINIRDIQVGSTISTGNKLMKNPLRLNIIG